MSTTPKRNETPTSNHSHLNGNGTAKQHAVGKLKNESTAKLMMGIPPASTPATAINGNGTTNHHLQQQPPPPPSTQVADFKGKAREVDPIYDIPIEQLKKELPLEEADLIPLAALVERLANHGYEALQNLAETLPSLPSSSRRAKIYTTALDVRKQFIKLLVLIRWSRDVADLQKARNVISLLAEQQWQHEDVFAGLTDVRKILPNARMRNADLPTAIDVLRTGTYRRLPASIKNNVVPPKPLSDQEALDVVAQLEDALRLRMVCRETVPAPMSRYQVQDGKVHFRVPGLFEAQLTASGGGATIDPKVALADRWWLLDLNFDLCITGPNADSATKLFPRKPRKAYRERLRIWGDRELEPKTGEEANAVEQSKEQEQVAPMEVDGASEQGAGTEPQEVAAADKPISSSKEKDAPLVRLYAFLQERSLHYHMDILQHQAMDLTRLNWGSNLKVQVEQRPRSLVLQYWVNAQSGAGTDAAKLAASSGAVTGGSIRITIAGKVGKNKVIADLLGDTEQQDDDSLPEQTKPEGQGGEMPFVVKQRHLQVTWDVDAAVKEEAGDVDLKISPQSLDVEQLLTELVHKHSSALLRVLRKRILTSHHPLSKSLQAQDCRVCSTTVRRKDRSTSEPVATTQVEHLHINLQGSRKPKLNSGLTGMPPIRLKVDAVTGKIQLELEADLGSDRSKQVLLSAFSASSLAAQPNSARLVDASERINASLDALLDVLYRLEIFARVEDWERKASYIGLGTICKLNFRPQEYSKFGPSLATCGPPVLYMPLGARYQGFYLALQPSEATGVNVALISAMQTMEGPGLTTVMLQSIEWLDRVRIAKASADQDLKQAEVNATGDISLEELASLHGYSVALVSYLRVEQQLRARAIPYLHVGNLTSKPEAPPPSKRRAESNDTEAGSSRLVPTICLRSQDLLGPAKSHLVKRNISLRVREWWDKDRIRAEISLKLRMKSRKLKTIRSDLASSSWLEFDGSTCVLTYSSRDLENCISGFLIEWERVSKIIELAREVLNVSRSKGTLHLEEFKLDSVVFGYGENLVVRVRRQEIGFLPGINRFWLEFGAQLDADWFGEEGVKANPHNAMAFELRRTINNGVGSWRGFFQLLLDTQPLVTYLSPFLTLCLTDASVPELEIKSVTWFRLRFLDWYALDIRLVSGSRYLLCDASSPLFRTPIKGLSDSLIQKHPTEKQYAPLPNFATTISQITDALNLRRALLIPSSKISSTLASILSQITSSVT